MRHEVDDHLLHFTSLLKKNPWTAWKYARLSVHASPERESTTLALDDFTAHFRKLLCPPIPDESDPRYAELDQLLHRLIPDAEAARILWDPGGFS
jgi:hypothetical protein